MKILIATFSDMGNRVGGLERALVDFSNAMNNKGLDVVLAYCAKKNRRFLLPIKY